MNSLLLLMSFTAMIKASGLMMGGGSCDTTEVAEYRKTNPGKSAAESALSCQRFCLSTYDSNQKITSTPRCFIDSSEKDSVGRKMKALLRGLHEDQIKDAVEIVRSAKNLDQAAKNLEAQFAKSSCEKVANDLAEAQRTYESVSRTLKCSSSTNLSTDGTIGK